MSKFSVGGGITENMRLKDVTADVNNVTAKVTIVLETDDMFAFGEALHHLRQVQQEQAATYSAWRSRPGGRLHE